MNPDVQSNEHGLLRELLRRFLVAELESSCGTGSTSGLGCGAGAALDSLLAAHRLDRRGRCRLCRDRGWWGPVSTLDRALWAGWVQGVGLKLAGLVGPTQPGRSSR